VEYLPYLLAIYDALNDDDSDIREIAAAATAPIVGKSVAAFEATELLLIWLQEHFGYLREFQSIVAVRLVDQPDLYLNDLEWTPLAVQLGRALEFDDSLFVVEEQNLFIDEIRESQRWLGVWRGLDQGGMADEELRQRLRDWTKAGLSNLVERAGDGDWPLGWTSDQHVFALCARVLLCSRALVDDEMQALCREFVLRGSKSGIHGCLLAMATVDPVTGG
jgi:hypothetical protein